VKARLGAESGAVEAGYHVGAPLDGSLLAEKAEPVLGPGGGQDLRLHLVALGAVEDRRLVELVEEADRQQDLTGTEPDVLPGPELEIGELHRNLAALLGALAARRVLELDLRIEQDLVAELVAQVGDVAQQVDARHQAGRSPVLLRRAGMVVGHLPVATDRNTLSLPVDLRGRRPESRLTLDRGVDFSGASRPALLQLLRKEVNAALQLGQPVALGCVGLEPRQLGGQRCDLLLEILDRGVVGAATRHDQRQDQRTDSEPSVDPHQASSI